MPLKEILTRLSLRTRRRFGWIRESLALAYYKRGTAYCNKGEYDRAIADLTNAVRLNPDDAKGVIYNRGVANGRKGDDDRAIADYTKAIQINPKDAWAFCNRGAAYGKKGASRERLRLYRSHTAGPEVGRCV